ncbi:MAG: hypothetical protein QXW98_04950 [Candidatus Caldarchaeum sp.]
MKPLWVYAVISSRKSTVSFGPKRKDDSIRVEFRAEIDGDSCTVMQVWAASADQKKWCISVPGMGWVTVDALAKTWKVELFGHDSISGALPKAL